MAIKALNPFAAFWYTPREEQASQNPTRFKLRGLNGTEQGYIGPELMFDESGRALKGLTGKGLELAFQFGLVDWENFANDAGRVVFSPQNFGLIPSALQVELAMQILGASYLQEEEKKT
jgi:hypothetical protein